jgi:membrane-associated phospholipid phosphatase
MAAQRYQQQHLLKNPVSLFFLFVLFSFIGSVVPVYAQEWQSPDSDTSLAHFPVKFVDDLPHLFITENIAPFAVGTAATAFDWAVLDQQNSLAASLNNWNYHSLYDFGNFYGEGWVEGLGAVGSWSIGAFTDNLRLQEFGRDASEALIESTILVTGLKYTVGRERPDGSNNQSFPSGHTIAAFCFAPVVQKYWGWGAGTAAYALGTVTMLARVAGYHHYLSDTIAGATLGIIIGNSVVYTPKDVTVGVGPGQMELKLAFN